MILEQKEYDLKMSALVELIDAREELAISKMIESLSNEIMEYENRIYPPPILHVKDRIEFMLDQSNAWNTL